MAQTKKAGRIEELEASSRKLEPSQQEYSTWLESTRKEALHFLEHLPHAKASYFQLDMESALKQGHPLDIPLNSLLTSGEKLFSPQPAPFSENIHNLFKILTRSGIDTAGGRDFGFIPGGGIPAAALADFTAALTNRYAGVFNASPAAVYLENEVLRTFIRWVGYPETAWGTLTSGGTLANLTGLLAARETRPRSEWDRSVIYLSDQAHHSLKLSLKVAGFDLNLVRTLATNADFSLDLNRLKAQIEQDQSLGLKPWILIATFGTTNTGSVDNLGDLIRIRNQYGLWLHVDAAYGGFFILTEKGKSLFQNGSEADSIVLDPHKGLFMPYGTGAVLVRNGEALRKPFHTDAEYLADLEHALDKSPSDYSPELTRPLRGIRIYLSLKTHGLGPFQAALEEKLALTEYAYEKLQQIPELEFACAPELTVIPFRIKGPEELTRQLLGDLLKNQKIYVSSTRLRGEFYLRLCILSFRTHLAEVDLAISEIQSLIKQLVK